MRPGVPELPTEPLRRSRHLSVVQPDESVRAHLGLSRFRLRLRHAECLILPEAGWSKPRPALPPWPEPTLNMWQFDAPDWSTQPGRAPLLLQNIGLVESWSGYAVSIAGQDRAWLVFPAVGKDGRTNLKVFSLWSWTGNPGDAPTRLVVDLRPFAVRPEAVDLVNINNQWRVLFVEDRYRGTGYATRNAVHWPTNILGIVP